MRESDNCPRTFETHFTCEVELLTKTVEEALCQAQSERGNVLAFAQAKGQCMTVCAARYRERRKEEANRIRDAIDENICARDDD